MTQLSPVIIIIHGSLDIVKIMMKSTSKMKK